MTHSWEVGEEENSWFINYMRVKVPSLTLYAFPQGLPWISSEVTQNIYKDNYQQYGTVLNKYQRKNVLDQKREESQWPNWSRKASEEEKLEVGLVYHIN